MNSPFYKHEVHFKTSAIYYLNIYFALHHRNIVSGQNTLSKSSRQNLPRVLFCKMTLPFHITSTPYGKRRIKLDSMRSVTERPKRDHNFKFLNFFFCGIGTYNLKIGKGVYTLLFSTYIFVVWKNIFVEVLI